MSEMLERVAKAIELAQGNAPFYVMPMFKDKYGVVEMMPPLHPDMYVRENLSIDEAEYWCEKLNGLWVAKQAIEALKPANASVLDILYTGHAGYDAWNKIVDAILDDVK